MLNNRLFWIIFTVLLLVALFLNLNIVPLSLEEPRRALVAMEMELSNNFIVPKLHGYHYYNKPPVFNWFLLALAKVFGWNEWVIRLPSVLSFLAIAFVNFKVMKLKVGLRSAIYSTIIFLSSAKLLFYFSFQGEIDLFFALIVYLQVVAIFHFFGEKKYSYLFLISYFLTGVGVLTKGLPSLAFQAITILVIFLYHKRFKELFSIWNFVGLGILIGIVGGYFLLYAGYKDPMQIITVLIFESTNRTAAGQSVFESIRHLFLFPLTFLSITLPWSIYIVIIRWRSAGKSILQNDWLKYSILFIASNIILYWLSAGTRDRYLYMFTPFVCGIIGYLLADEEHHSRRWLGLISYFIIIVLTLALIGMPWIVPRNMYQPALIALIIFLAPFLFFHWAFLKNSGQSVLSLFGILILTRIIFDIIVLPIRVDEAPNYENLTKELTELANGNQIMLLSDVEKKFRYNAIVRDSVMVDEIDCPPYQFSYYLTKTSGRVFQHIKQPKSGDYFICKKEYPLEGNYLVIKEFSIERKKKKIPYMLIRSLLDE